MQHVWECNAYWAMPCNEEGVKSTGLVGFTPFLHEVCVRCLCQIMYKVMTFSLALSYSDFIVTSIRRLQLRMVCATFCMSAADSWSIRAS